MSETVLMYAMGAAAVASLVPAARARWQLSRAKHPSLAGHSRMARRVAALVPFYDYDEARFYTADGAPQEVARTRQQAFDKLAAVYRERFALTDAATERIRPGIADLQFTDHYRVPYQFARQVQRHLKTGSLVASSSHVFVTDLDGNRFYDLTGSYGVNLFGMDFYKDCIDEGARRVHDLGPVLGSYHPVIETVVAQLRQISGLDEVSFHMSGTEAVMQAVRLARYHTRRKNLVRFNGSYHGWWGDVQPGVGNPVTERETYTLRDMDERTLTVLRSRNDIACVLVNPLQALHPNAGAPGDNSLVAGRDFPPSDHAAYGRWLQQLREVCTERGIVLIFDEVFVGFRLARGGAQEYFGVRADLVTYGKTLGGGLPVGVVCGRADLMRRYRDDRPVDICFARGTFNSHPYVIGAMQAFLDRLQTPQISQLYEGLDPLWNDRARRLNRRLADAGIPVHVRNLSSIWTVCFDAPSSYNWMFQYYLRTHGLALSWVGTGRLVFSLNYTGQDFDQVADRFVAAGQAMLADAWWWCPQGATNKAVRRRIFHEMLRARRVSGSAASAAGL